MFSTRKFPLVEFFLFLNYIQHYSIFTEFEYSAISYW